MTGANSDPSTQGAKPAGGNVGAFATGYTPGPEAQALTLNRETDEAVVRLDQRIDDAEIDEAGIYLVGANGNDGANPLVAGVQSQAHRAPRT